MAQAELFLVENLLLTEWGFALLKHGSSEELVRARALLKEASEKFQEMGADGFVELLEGKLAHIE